MKEKIKIDSQEQYNNLVELIEEIVKLQYQIPKNYNEKFDNYYDVATKFDRLFTINKTVRQKGINFEP